MDAREAKRLVTAYKTTIVEPRITDIYPYIKRYAEMGETAVNYGVDEKAKATPNILDELKVQGYDVQTIPGSQGQLVLVISWSDNNLLKD